MERSKLDYGMIYYWSWTLSGFISLLYGLVVLGILIFMTVISTSDLLYINNPTIQGKVRHTIDGRRIGGFRVVSRDAVKAVEEAYTSGKTAMQIYLRYRYKTYLFASVTLVVLISGGEAIIPLATNIVSNILKSLGFM